jgi:hypothetical protein
MTPARSCQEPTSYAIGDSDAPPRTKWVTSSCKTPYERSAGFRGLPGSEEPLAISKLNRFAPALAATPLRFDTRARDCFVAPCGPLALIGCWPHCSHGHRDR